MEQLVFEVLTKELENLQEDLKESLANAAEFERRAKCIRHNAKPVEDQIVKLVMALAE